MMEFQYDARSLFVTGEFLQSSSGTDACLLTAACKSDIDEDQEDIAVIVSRLGQERQPLVSVSCSCPELPNEYTTKPVKRIPLHSDSDSSEDEEDFSLKQLLKAFGLYSKKQHEKRSPGAIRNLIQSYCCTEEVSTGDIHEICGFIEDGDRVLLETSLELLKKVSKKKENAKIVSESILPVLFNKLVNTSLVDTIVCQILDLINQVLNQESSKDLWIDYVNSSRLNVVKSLMSGIHSRCIRLQAGNVFRSLIRYSEFVPYIMDNVLNDILILRDEDTDFKVLYTDIITRLMMVCSEVNEVQLDSDLLPALMLMLKEGPCGPQSHSLTLLASLAEGEDWTRKILKAGLVPLIMSACLDSECRDVRATAVKTLNRLLSVEKSSIQKLVLLHTDHCLHAHEDLPVADSPRTRAVEIIKKGTKKSDITTKLQRSVKEICKCTVDEFNTAAIAEKMPDGSGVVIHYSPGVDKNDKRLSSMISSVHLMATLSCLKTSRTKVKLDNITEEEVKNLKAMQADWYKINHGIVKILINAGALSVIDLLHKFTLVVKRSCLPPIEGRLSIKSAWSPSGDSKTPRKSAQSPTTDIFSEKELELLGAILDLLQLWSSASSLYEHDSLEVTCSSRPNPSNEEDDDEDSDNTPVEKRYKERLKEEVKDIMRFVRRKLFQNGLIQCIYPILKFQDQQMSGTLIKEKAFYIISCVVQTVEEAKHQNPAPPPSVPPPGNMGHTRRRPASAMTSREKERTLNMALYRMSSKTRDCIQEVLNENAPETEQKTNIAQEVQPKAEAATEQDEQSNVSVQPVTSPVTSSSSVAIMCDVHSDTDSSGEKVLPVVDNIDEEEEEWYDEELDFMNQVEEHYVNWIEAQSSRELGKSIDSSVPRDENFNRLLQLGESFDRCRSEIGYYLPNYDRFARASPLQRPRTAIDGLINSDYAKARERFMSQDKNTCKDWGRPFSTEPIPMSKRTNYHDRVVANRPGHRLAPLSIRTSNTDHTATIAPQKLIPSSTTPASSSNENTDSWCESASTEEGTKRPGKVSRPGSAKKTRHKRSSGKTEVRRKTPEKNKSFKPVSQGSKSEPKVSKRKHRTDEPKNWKPQMDPLSSVCTQCQMHTANLAMNDTLKHIFSKNESMKTAAVLCLQETVKHGNRDVHMKMSEHGIIPKMIDFLRVNDDKEPYLLAGLGILRMLIQSDVRLCRLFSYHNGSQLLMALSNSTTGYTRSEVTATLKLVTRGTTNTPKSAPVRGIRRIHSAPVGSTRQPADIWDHILMRWRNEDMVSKVLRQPNVR